MTGTLVNYTPASASTKTTCPGSNSRPARSRSGRMAAGSYLILSSREDDEIVYYVQFAQGGRGGIRAEAESNNFLAVGGRCHRCKRSSWPGSAGNARCRATAISTSCASGPLPRHMPRCQPCGAEPARVYGTNGPAELVYRGSPRPGGLCRPALGLKPEKPGDRHRPVPAAVPTVRN